MYYLPWELELSRLDVEHKVAIFHSPEVDVRWFIRVAKMQLCCLVKPAHHLSDVLQSPEFRTFKLHYRVLRESTDLHQG